jgi:hypothetical protein
LFRLPYVLGLLGLHDDAREGLGRVRLQDG